MKKEVCVKFYKQFIRKYLLEQIICLIILLLYSATNIIYPFFLKLIIDNAIAGGSVSKLRLFVLLMVVNTLFMVGFKFFQTYKYTQLGQKIVGDIKNEAIERLLNYRLKFFRGYQSGELLNTIENEITVVQTMITSISNDFLVQIISIIGLGVVIAGFDYQTLLAIIILLQIQIFIQKKFGLVIRNKAINFIKTKGEVYTLIQLFIKKVNDIKMLNFQNYLKQNYQNKQKEYFDSEISIVSSQSFLNSVSVCFQSLALVVVMLIGGYKVLMETLTVGTLFSLTLYVQQFYSSVTSLSGLHIQLKKAEASLNKLSQLLYNEDYVIPQGQLKKTEFNSDITFSNVTYAYDEKPVLKDINFSIKKYDKVALIGRNGSGKTTFIRLLYKMCDYSGSICIDGQDIKDINSSFINDNMMCITQDTLIFNGTIRENILFGRNDINEAELEGILEKVYLLSDIKNMKNGVETIIGDKGLLLSGGQMQKIALARLFAIKPAIIILDEPTSALDLEAEKFICHKIYQEFADKTIIAITHRDELLNYCSRIIEIKDSAITECRKDDSYEFERKKSLYKVF